MWKSIQLLIFLAVTGGSLTALWQVKPPGGLPIYDVFLGSPGTRPAGGYIPLAICYTIAAVLIGMLAGEGLRAVKKRLTGSDEGMIPAPEWPRWLRRRGGGR